MASRLRVPAIDRDHAPPDDKLVARLSQPELNMRCRAVRHLREAAGQIRDPEIRHATERRAKLMRDAMPYREFLAERQKREAAMDELPGTGRDAHDLRMGHREALRELREKNPYPSRIEDVYELEVRSAKG